MTSLAVWEVGTRGRFGAVWASAPDVSSASIAERISPGRRKRDDSGRPSRTIPVGSDHEGLKNALARVLACPWQRCTVHFVRDMLYHCRRDQRGLVSAALREVFNAEHRDQARERLTHVIARLEPVAPKVCRLLEEAEEDLIAFYAFPSEHWTKLRSTNPLERVNKEIGRRSDVVGIFPNDASVIRLAGALLSEQNDEWLVQRRYLSAESMTLILSAAQFEKNSLEQQQHKEATTLNAA